MTPNMIRARSDNPLEAFNWSPQPQAQALVHELTDDIVKKSPSMQKLASRLHSEAGVRFGDIIDYLTFPSSPLLRQRLTDACFEEDALAGAPDVFAQPHGMFPRIRLSGQSGLALAMRVESIADFLVAYGSDVPIEGKPYAPVRLSKLLEENGRSLLIIEQHGSRAVVPVASESRQTSDMLRVLETFRMRRRAFENPADGFAHALKLVDAAIAQVGAGGACDMFFTAEREYWQKKNRAGQVQKARQDRLGLGWSNHDHHTYRSSRQYFSSLVAVLERLGFTCRERFYAGKQAGWGAQILEQPEARITVFADVDLGTDEIMDDFAHDPLPPRQQLGTVGLWCALHGEAFLEAGMHHLECQFDFDALKQQLETDGNVKMLKPFTNFPYLRQAFTEGEVWPVNPQRIERLLTNGQITAEQAERFRTQGALGSHLENLERNDGFKGFNQTGISEIIHRTDPRAQMTPW